MDKIAFVHFLWLIYHCKILSCACYRSILSSSVLLCVSHFVCDISNDLQLKYVEIYYIL